MESAQKTLEWQKSAMKSKQIQHSENVEMQVEHLIQDMDVKMDLNEK